MKGRILSITLVGLGAAILAVLSPLAMPIGVVPLTLQTLAVGLIATVLRARETFLAVLIYLILGLAGLPVFSGGTAGFGVLLGPMGGFLLAFLFVGTLISWLTRQLRDHLAAALVVNSLCYLFTLLIGTVWFKYFTLGTTWPAAFEATFLPFIPVEIAKAVVATLLGLAIVRVLAHQHDYFR